MENKDIVIVCGKICSGKNTFSKILVDSGEFAHIVVSDVVKALSGALHRSKLSETADLDLMIADEIIQITKDHFKSGKSVVIDGMRQKSIYDVVCSEFSDKEIMSVWLEVPKEILLSRYLKRGDKKDDMSFDEALKKDAALGLEELESHLKSLDDTLIVKTLKQ